MRVAVLLLLTSLLGCATNFQSTLAALQSHPEPQDAHLYGHIGALPAGLEGDRGAEAAKPEPPPQYGDESLALESYKDGRICFQLTSLPSDYLSKDPSDELKSLQKRPFRVEAFEDLGAVPPRPLILTTAGEPLPEVTAMGAREHTYKGDLHHQDGKGLTDEHDVTLFHFLLCGRAPAIGPGTRFLAVTEDGGWMEQRLYLFKLLPAP